MASFLSGFRDILDYDPELAFFGAIPQTGTTPFQNYYSGRFGNIYDKFLGAQGRALWSGRNPVKTFPDYLENFPWLQNFQALSPTQRGETPARFAPSVRFAG